MHDTCRWLAARNKNEKIALGIAASCLVRGGELSFAPCTSLIIDAVVEEGPK